MLICHFVSPEVFLYVQCTFFKSEYYFYIISTSPPFPAPELPPTFMFSFLSIIARHTHTQTHTQNLLSLFSVANMCMYLKTAHLRFDNLSGGSSLEKTDFSSQQLFKPFIACSSLSGGGGCGGLVACLLYAFTFECLVLLGRLRNL